MLKRTNKEGRQRLWGFPRPEITWIELNPRKVRNDPILPNPVETVRKNLLEFPDDPILPGILPL